MIRGRNGSLALLTRDSFIHNTSPVYPGAQEQKATERQTHALSAVEAESTHRWWVCCPGN